MRGLCRRMTVLFWALAAVAAAISLVFMEDIRILISCGLLLAVLFLWSRLFMRAFQRELLDFTDGICAQMDRMMDGPAWGETGGGERGGTGRTGTESAVAQESLFGKILQKLERLVEARDSALRKMTEERDSLQRLISDIAHQTKTPLANLKLLGERLSGTDRERGTEGGLVEGELFAGQIDKLDFLIQAMAKTSRMESGMIRLVKKEQSLLETVVQTMNGVLEAADEKGMDLDLQCPEDCRLPHDRKWTAEALFNILDNAVKYTEPGGTVSVTAEEGEMYVKISIRDNGRGIPEEEQGAVFARFYRAGEVHEEPGAGLGLYLTRQIVMKQGGYIKVKSAPKEGSEFLVFLPVRP